MLIAANLPYVVVTEIAVLVSKDSFGYALCSLARRHLRSGLKWSLA